MGLEDVVKDKAYQVGDVKVDRPRTMNLPREWWEALAAHNPSMLYFFAKDFKEKQILWYIMLLDEVIQDELGGMKVSDDQKEAAREAREELLDYL